MRVRWLHPGVSVGDVVDNTGFELDFPDMIPTTPEPTDDELRLIREVLDPDHRRKTEVPAE
jgi:hypothetical protein